MLRFVGLPQSIEHAGVTIDAAQVLAAARPVEVVYFDEPIATVLRVASVWSLIAGVVVDVNAIDNGQHGPHTLHGRSKALDLDTEGDKRADLLSLYEHLRTTLPPGYDVILEDTHAHVEWDVHRR